MGIKVQHTVSQYPQRVQRDLCEGSCQFSIFVYLQSFNQFVLPESYFDFKDLLKQWIFDKML